MILPGGMGRAQPLRRGCFGLGATAGALGFGTGRGCGWLGLLCDCFSRFGTGGLGSVFLTRLGFVDQLAVNLDPAQVQQTGFEACAWLTGPFAFLVEKRI